MDQEAIVSQIELILAEKRTSLSVLRTGIAILVLPLSLFTILIATSRYYDMATALALIVPVLVICVGLISLGIYLIVRSTRRIIRHDRRVQKLAQKDPRWKEFLD